MRFKDWISRLDESSLNNLYQSTVAAFPYTTKRQYATDPVRIVELAWTPFVGVNTLFVKGTAESGASGRMYQPMVLFRGVHYHPEKESQDWVEIVANDGRHYVLERLSYAGNDVLLRCNCLDFSYRGNYADHLDDSLYGRVRRRYESLGIGPPANPTNAPMMCKHLIKLIESMDHAGIFMVE